MKKKVTVLVVIYILFCCWDCGSTFKEEWRTTISSGSSSRMAGIHRLREIEFDIPPHPVLT